MPYKEVKVYNDGSHYIGIPHTTRPNLPHRHVEEEIAILEAGDSELQEENTSSKNEGVTSATQIIEIDGVRIDTETGEVLPPLADEPPKIQRKTTKKDLFNELYRSSMDLPKHERKKMIIEKMRPHFKSDKQVEEYVTANLDRKLRNLISRRIRLTRKVNLQEFNYFVTQTYDSALHTEDSFRKKLRNTLSHFCSRKNWRYVGVWERSPENKRLHFHGIFYIPDGTMPGTLIEKNDYSFITHKRQITIQNTYFNENFGRSDFETLDDERNIGDAMAYLLKYIEKSGEKIVYSRGLPQYFISDIMDEDVVCPIGLEDKKLLLFDDFSCFDDGYLIGNVSPATIKQLRKSN